jgi:ubiquinone/menaquinone biosynthesis C-methylase UbiE
MNKLWRRFVRKAHPEGIPWAGVPLYDTLSRSGIFMEHYGLVARDVERYFRGGRLLDIGTGPGRLLACVRKAVPRAEIIGIDISPAMAVRAAANVARGGCAGEIAVVAASATALPFADGSIDCVVSTGSLHHWKDTGRGLEEMHRVLKRGGYALLYDIVRKLPDDVAKRNREMFGRFRVLLLWLHSFEEPFYTVEEMASLAVTSPFLAGEVHFTGALCCLVLRRK